MHVDNVFEVFIFLILIFGYFFYARRGAYLIMFILLKTFSGASRHNASQKIFKIQDTMQYQHPINAGREEKKIYSANKLYIPSWSHRASDSGNIHCLQIKSTLKI